ncbi:MAG: hypothetical protein ACHQQS_06790 [Thermoanaerobaculales bacterium]
MDFELLQAFRNLFDGRPYLHRVSTHGDWVAQFLFEDLVRLKKAQRFVRAVAAQEVVVNTANKAWGIAARRGDGSLGELVPGAKAREAPPFRVARGLIANVQIGVETKILAKAMIKQVDRVMNDLRRQATQFKHQGPNAITVALVGVNHADRCVGYERDRVFPSEISPAREAPEAMRRILAQIGPSYDEVVFLRFKASNEEPFPFEWVDAGATALDYASALTRISRLYDERF